MGDSILPKVIFFDAAGTLIRLPKGAGWHYANVAIRHGISLDAVALETAFSAAWKAADVLPETRTPREEAEKAWWRKLVFSVLRQCEAKTAGQDLDESTRAMYFEDLYQEFTLPGIWELYPEVPRVLERLSQITKLAGLSNFDQRLFPILQNLGIGHYFTHWTLSSEVGAEKPSPWIFQKALEQADVAAAEALHVGDDPRCDWEGAHAAGLQVFELRRPMNSLMDLLR